MILLSRNEFESNSTGNFNMTYDECIIAYIKLHNQDKRYKEIMNSRLFSAIVCDPLSLGYSKFKGIVKFNKCIKCGWGYPNSNGIVNISINYWRSEVIEKEEYRDVLIDNINES